MNIRIEQGVCRFAGEDKASDPGRAADQSSGNIETKLQTTTIQKYHIRRPVGFFCKNNFH